MAKQIYIDENGNPIEVSGTINTAELLPISGNDTTNTKEYIDNKIGVSKIDITNNVTFNENITGTNTRVYFYGGVLYIFYQGESKTHSQNTQLFTLPSGYRPTETVYGTFIINDTGFGTCYVDDTGKGYISHVSGGNTSGRVYFTMAIPLR